MYVRKRNNEKIVTFWDETSAASTKTSAYIQNKIFMIRYLWLCKNSVMRFLFSCVASTVTMSGFVVGTPVHGFRPIAKASHIRFTPENFLANIDNIKVYYMTYRCSPSAQFYLQVGSTVLLECKYVSSADQTNEYVIILYALIHAG